ncbi:hypothetical protein [Burkholderia territorii]|uniref:Uncharacterized protein n=1 Tax=Burkholderia territorii TaxID=1503055 RepID=A0A6L3NQ69_9BURK|nr:hypothetical protein [Burkholderia territorii]KAB0685940.1 hypothetical protein F7R13_02520 [Burkholderia territorii]MBM2777457.1 hypothetical protein [Burkholderia territorii]
MHIREQGSLIKVLRVASPEEPSARACSREQVIGTFRADEPVPAALLDVMTRDEREALTRWLEVYQHSRWRTLNSPLA